MNLAFLQKNTDTHNMNNTVSALIAVADATALSSADKQKLVALVQSRQASNSDDSESPALAAAADVTRGSDIVPDVLGDLVDNAQTQLDDTRVALSDAAHSFALLRQFIENELTQDSKALTKKRLEVFHGPYLDRVAHVSAVDPRNLDPDEDSITKNAFLFILFTRTQTSLW